MVKLYPLWSVWVTLSHANYLSAPKSKAAHLLCLHKNFSSVRIARNFRHWVMCHVRTLQVQSRFSPAVFLAAVWLLKWQSETVDKESDVKNPEVKFFFFFRPPEYERGFFLLSYASLKVGQFYLWLCNGMKEQLCSPLQGGSVYPHYLINALLASCCPGARG